MNEVNLIKTKQNMIKSSRNDEIIQSKLIKRHKIKYAE